MIIGVSSYSFKKMINAGKITQLTCIQKAKEIGFDAIEFTDLMPPEGVSEAEYAKKISDECKRVGIQMGSYTIGADLINGNGCSPQDEVARIKSKVDIAAILGCTTMRHDATSGIDTKKSRYKSFDALLPKLINGCKEITGYAKKLGIKTMVENHGFFAQDSARVEKLISGVDDENFGALIDIGNFLCVDETPFEAVGRLAPYAFHVHAKDFHIKSGNQPDPGKGWFRTRGGNFLRGAIIGHGNVPIAQCIGALKRTGYDDTLSIEFEGMEDSVPALEIGLENLKRYIQMV